MSDTPKPGEIITPDQAVEAPVAEPVAASTASKSAIDWKIWLKQHWMLVAGISVLVLAVVAAVGYQLTRENPAAAPAKQAVQPPAEPPKTTKASPLTGVELPIADADKPVVGVVIENHPDARPQSGLSSAGVVYEALAEGGITRFLAFFLENKPKEYGPIRSLRTYFVSWALEFGAPVAHVGGNYDALELVKPLGLVSLNQFSYANFFYRTRDRYAPHNMYSDTAKMDGLLAHTGTNKPATFTPTPRKADAAEATPTRPKIGINYSFNGFQVEYRYDAATNSYLRFLNGAPHIDRNTGQQIKVKNVVVEYMPIAHTTTRIGEQALKMGASGLPIGTGKAHVFRDGGVVEGTWSKTNHNVRTQILDATGKEIPLNIGNTWYSIVPIDRPVSY